MKRFIQEEKELIIKRDCCSIFVMTKCNVKGVKGRVEEAFLYFEVTENVWYCNYSLHDKSRISARKIETRVIRGSMRII